MEQKCIFLETGGKCEKKTTYGCYCKKHKRVHLVDHDNNIILQNFTYIEADYLKADLCNYYRTNIIPAKKIGKLKKKEIYEKVRESIKSKNHYTENVAKIVMIQSLVRRKTITPIVELKCNNQEDFYSYDLLISIPRKYYYSYLDPSDFRWGFDIRSLHKLIELNYPNPYTTEEIPPSIKRDIQAKFEILKGGASYEDNIELIERDRNNMIKQNTVDLFSLIEQHGYSCDIDWFLNLSFRRLKELYKHLEDLWNYRLGLTDEYKRIISPPNGCLFSTPVSEVINYNHKEDIQELILHDVSKINRCEIDSDRRMGYFYFIIGLGQVSPNCWNAHHQILSII